MVAWLVCGAVMLWSKNVSHVSLHFLLSCVCMAEQHGWADGSVMFEVAVCNKTVSVVLGALCGIVFCLCLI